MFANSKRVFRISAVGLALAPMLGAGSGTSGSMMDGVAGLVGRLIAGR